MSLFRLIIWSSLIGGWSAFFGWLFSETILHLWITNVVVAIIMATVVAIPIGGGICCASGFFIGLAQVVLKEAWLTVEAGFRPGRQMILGGDLITMGTSEKSSMIFIAFGAKGVEPTHLKIIKQADGRFLLEDNQSRTGTLLNGQRIAGPRPLADGDAIQFGVNVVRFNERVKHGETRLPA